jgi:hypothetical protein
VPEEAVEHKVEIDVGHRRYHRVYVGEGQHLIPDFIGEKVPAANAKEGGRTVDVKAYYEQVTPLESL